MPNCRRKELQKQNGRYVGDVQVFEDHNERETLGRVREYVADRIHELETRLLGSEVRGVSRRLRLWQLGEDLRKGTHVRIDLPRLGGAKGRRAALAPMANTQVRLQLPSIAPRMFASRAPERGVRPLRRAGSFQSRARPSGTRRNHGLQPRPRSLR